MSTSDPGFEYDFNRQRKPKPVRNELYWRYKKQEVPKDQNPRNGRVTTRKWQPEAQPVTYFVPKHIKDIMREA